MGKTRYIVGIDASRSVGRVRTGTENYSAQIVRALVSETAGFSWRLYFNGGSHQLELPCDANVELRDIPARRLWTHLRLSRELLQHPINGLFVPAHVVPFYHPPSVVTIHDLGYLHWPEAHGARQVRMLDLTTRWSARVARHIIVPSMQTARDLMDAYNVPESRMTVIHHGIDPSMSPVPDDTDATLRNRYGLPARFVLAVGTMQPRKNLGTLAHALGDLVKQHDISLVIAGRKGWMYEQVEHELHAAGLGDRLRVLDYVPSADLPALYRTAEVFAQPSRYEGFGMPVLEAMACGTAVIAARGSSLDEIAGTAAVRFDHDDPGELASGLQTLLTDADRRDHLVANGHAWTAQFTWEQSARKTRIVLEENLMD